MECQVTANSRDWSRRCCTSRRSLELARRVLVLPRTHRAVRCVSASRSVSRLLFRDVTAQPMALAAAFGTALNEPALNGAILTLRIANPVGRGPGATAVQNRRDLGLIGRGIHSEWIRTDQAPGPAARGDPCQTSDTRDRCTTPCRSTENDPLTASVAGGTLFTLRQGVFRLFPFRDVARIDDVPQTRGFSMADANSFPKRYEPSRWRTRY